MSRYAYDVKRLEFVTAKELALSLRISVEAVQEKYHYSARYMHSAYLYPISGLPVEARIACLPKLCEKRRAYKMLALLENCSDLKGMALKKFLAAWNLLNPDCVVQYSDILGPRDAYLDGRVLDALTYPNRVRFDYAIAAEVVGEMICKVMFCERADKLLELSDEVVLLTESFVYR